MTFVEVLYYITIKPLELFFEVVYMMAYRIIGSPNLAIIALSLAMNFLVLPLYRRADAMQEEERKTEERLGAGVKHIKQAFKGDERMMILQTYYRQNHYKQSYVLRGSLPLLLEVPFFIAAYRFLSSLEILQGVSFGPIADLGAPDGLLVIGGIAINVLPVLMTLINIISSSIYADHMSRKTKIQLYVMAAIFLVFLYDSPAGLVFYWTLNNLFSLIKNVFYKLPNPRKVLRVLSMLVGIAAAGYFGVIYQTPSILRKGVMVGASSLLVIIPLIQILRGRHVAINMLKNRVGLTDRKGGRVTANSVFIIGVLYLTILIGGLIPSAVVASSPEDFVTYVVFYDPTGAVIAALCLATGYFLVWCGIFYALASEYRREQFALLVIAASIIATLDYMVFKPRSSSGTLSSILAYEHGLLLDSVSVIASAITACVVLVMVFLVGRHFADLCRSVLQVMCIVVLVMTVVNMGSIRSAVHDFQQRSGYMADVKAEPKVTLSKTGQNVVVIMLDRGIGAYMPYILAEVPELKDAFDGFTYYPNTLSYGGSTIYGVPGLTGGYEYTTLAMNKRSDELLSDKHDEALLMMPVLFSEEGYDVTVCDPPYAGYVEQGDYSIYADYPGITAINMQGKTNPYKQVYEAEQYRIRKRNLFCYSVVRVLPAVLQPAAYNDGQYNTAPATANNPYAQGYVYDTHTARGYNGEFLDSYYTILDLDELTQTNENDKGCYVFMNNEMVHGPILLQEPEYTVAYEVDNTEYDEEHQNRFTVNGETAVMESGEQMAHYESMMASMIMLGDWFDYLRENDLYDNTRIIIVSDHAFNLGSFPNRILEDGTDTMRYNPLLMVKDYDAQGFETSDEFMTNCDVPYLSVQNVIENAANPFTGKQITNDSKNGVQYVLRNDAGLISENQGTQFVVDEWLSVEGDVRDADSWNIVSEGTTLPVK